MSWDDTGQPGWHILGLRGTEPADLAHARQWVHDRLDALAEAHRADVLLVVNELLENAYVHAGGPRELRVHHTGDACEVTVAVADSGSGKPRTRVPGAPGGSGLALVEQLSAAWGVSHHDDGKLVWARVGCPRDEAGY
ncbi:ATP-binding protein [Amycolatopsis pretoriensis]|uniref:ATP-binding protein n=1 Tax=Amycolatopsis pretoriensis TaxID=218821 RepID=UPI001FC9D3D4|nr:ATP-binding protein [Amycolatopsis pretoriensis]